MTAGRGIVHIEMPVITTGDLWGFQLWINLPRKDKMIKPRYQDIQAAEIPTVTTDEGVLCGLWHTYSEARMVRALCFIWAGLG